jgi:DNA-binding response OmpR family regulator
LQNGFQIHLAKPVDPAELVAVVAALARTSGSGPCRELVAGMKLSGLKERKHRRGTRLPING